MTTFGDYDGIWPEAGLSIEEGGGNERYVALLQWQHAPQMKEHSYIAGYRLAAEIIFNHVGEKGHDQDILFFPLALAWRQHMELQLKSTLLELQRFQRKDLEYVKSHDLAYLWRRVRVEIEEAQPNDTSDLPNVQEILMQLHKMDRTGQEFRYPTISDQKPSLPALKRVNLEAFHTAMLRVANFFDGEGGSLYEDARMRDEYEEFRRNEADGI